MLSDYALYKCRFFNGVGYDGIAGVEHFSGFLCRVNALRVDGSEALPCRDRIADLLLEDKADGKVDYALLETRPTSSAQMCFT